MAMYNTWLLIMEYPFDFSLKSLRIITRISYVPLFAGVSLCTFPSSIAPL